MKTNYQGSLTSTISFFFLLKLILLFSTLAILFQFIPGLSQFVIKFRGLYSIAVILLFASAITSKNIINIGVASLLMAITLYTAFSSGYKENVLMLLLVLGALLYPKYKNGVIFLGAPVFIILLLILPTFVANFRQLSWERQINTYEATRTALRSLQGEDRSILQKANWDFLCNRFSEISIFTTYLKKVPTSRPYYEFQIIRQGLLSIIPRVLYPNKPDMEVAVMERVRENKIIEDYSINVSVKPQLIVDGYLSFGYVGAWLFCFVCGEIATSIAHWCENLFGGFQLGIGLFYTGLFEIFLRGNAFEFMLNAIFWSVVTAFLLKILIREPSR